jgi:hypothetical protein
LKKISLMLLFCTIILATSATHMHATDDKANIQAPIDLSSKNIYTKKDHLMHIVYAAIASLGGAVTLNTALRYDLISWNDSQLMKRKIFVQSSVLLYTLLYIVHKRKTQRKQFSESRVIFSLFKNNIFNDIINIFNNIFNNIKFGCGATLTMLGLGLYYMNKLSDIINDKEQTRECINTLLART